MPFEEFEIGEEGSQTSGGQGQGQGQGEGASDSGEQGTRQGQGEGEGEGQGQGEGEGEGQGQGEGEGEGQGQGQGQGEGEGEGQGQGQGESEGEGQGQGQGQGEGEEEKEDDLIGKDCAIIYPKEWSSIFGTVLSFKGEYTYTREDIQQESAKERGRKLGDKNTLWEINTQYSESDKENPILERDDFTVVGDEIIYKSKPYGDMQSAIVVSLLPSNKQVLVSYENEYGRHSSYVDIADIVRVVINEDEKPEEKEEQPKPKNESVYVFKSVTFLRQFTKQYVGELTNVKIRSDSVFYSLPFNMFLFIFDTQYAEYYSGFSVLNIKHMTPIPNGTPEQEIEQYKELDKILLDEITERIIACENLFKQKRDFLYYSFELALMNKTSVTVNNKLSISRLSPTRVMVMIKDGDLVRQYTEGDIEKFYDANTDYILKISFAFNGGNTNKLQIVDYESNIPILENLKKTLQVFNKTI